MIPATQLLRRTKTSALTKWSCFNLITHPKMASRVKDDELLDADSKEKSQIESRNIPQQKT